MKLPFKISRTMASSIGLVLVTSGAAVALNVAIVRAASDSGTATDEAALASESSPLSATLDVGTLRGSDEATEVGNEETAPAAVVPVSTMAALPTSTVAPVTSAPATAPPSSAAPTTAPAPTVAPAPSTTYETFQVGNIGEVVIANHGTSLEFWAAYAADGWEFGVENQVGSEITVKFRGDGGEVEWKAKLKDGEIRIESSNENEDNDSSEEEDDD